MKHVEAVYMFTDLEGVAGVDAWDPRFRGSDNQALDVYAFAEMQRLLTEEVNAAAEGLVAAGVQGIVINDAHGRGRTILVEELIPGVKIVKGEGRPTWLVGISPRFDALVQIGMHAMAGTPHACLSHTQSPGYVYRLNGREFGEMEQAALLAGELGIPWIFTAGDEYACREAEAWVPGMVSAAVKTGVSITCALHLAPVDARTLIRDRIQVAVARASEIAPLEMEGPFVMEVEREDPWPATSIRPGAERVNAHTVRYTGESFWSVFHHHFYGDPDYPRPIA